jgi:hypothetical protein
MLPKRIFMRKHNKNGVKSDVFGAGDNVAPICPKNNQFDVFI